MQKRQNGCDRDGTMSDIVADGSVEVVDSESAKVSEDSAQLVLDIKARLSAPTEQTSPDDKPQTNGLHQSNGVSEHSQPLSDLDCSVPLNQNPHTSHLKQSGMLSFFDDCFCFSCLCFKKGWVSKF